MSQQQATLERFLKRTRPDDTNKTGERDGEPWRKKQKLEFKPQNDVASSPNKQQHYQKNNTSSSSGWDAHHVRLPSAPENKYKNDAGKYLSKWYLISSTLEATLSSAYDLEEAILMMNPGKNWRLAGLKDFFAQYGKVASDYFFQTVLPRMQTMALELPRLITKPIPLLVQNKNATVSLSQEQIACLLCHAFFCTFPRRNSFGSTDEYYNYPSVNFVELFKGVYGKCEKTMVEKLKALIHYFDVVTREKYDPTVISTYNNGTVANPNLRHVEFERITMVSFPDWAQSSVELCKIEINLDGKIEDDGNACHLDFANKKIGGGVLGKGCVQVLKQFHGNNNRRKFGSLSILSVSFHGYLPSPFWMRNV